jgi:hypothetical protein
VNFNYLGKKNISTIAAKVKKITEWNKYTFRQETYKVHQHTKTIPIIFDKDFKHNNPTYHSNYKNYKKDLKKFEKFFTTKFGQGYIIRAILVNLLAKKNIPEHIDKGFSLDACKRVHIPIITNAKVFFNVGGEKINLKKGELWEINNSQKTHSVENKSKYDRVHLIIDWVIK